jgi:hypothetical protein
MGVESRGWDVRDVVIAVGVVVGVIFVLIELTGHDIDRQASQTGGTAVAVLLFSIVGSAGVALAHWQPRLALFGAMTVTLSLLAFGATVASIWNGGDFGLGFGYGGASGTVGGITDLLAVASSAACVLLALVRPGEDGGARIVRVAAIGALALIVGLGILQILDYGIDIGARIYAILATVYVVATVVLLVLRLLPVEEETYLPS